VKHLLIILSILLLSSPLFGQSEKPQTIIVPTGSLGEISEIRKKMLEKTLESKLDDYFDIVPKELFEEAQEQAFQEMDADECTEEQCIMMIREILQVENSFQMVLMEEEGDTQISLTWNDLDKKRVEEEYCEGCKTKQLRKMIEGLVEKLIGVKNVEQVLVETPKVVPQVVQETVVHKTEEDKTKGLFVTVGDKGTILISSDGISWISRESGTSEHLHGITNKNGLFVTVGGKGTILTSRDGISWTERYGTLNGHKSSAWLFGISEGNGIFVAVGDKGTIFTSSDGTQWTSRNLKVDMYGDSVPKTTDEFKGVIFGNGLFVTVSWNGTIFTSSDGTIWTERQIVNTKRLVPLRGVNYGSEIFVAVGHDETILTSKDGVSWTQVRTGTYNLNNVIYKNGLFLSSGTDGRTLNSSNGLRWEVMTPETKVDLFGVSYGKREFVFVGKNGTVRTSPDGIGWTSRTSGTTENLYGVTYKE